MCCPTWKRLYLHLCEKSAVSQEDYYTASAATVAVPAREGAIFAQKSAKPANRFSQNRSDKIELEMHDPIMPVQAHA